MTDQKTTHAILSASSAARWLACPPSAQLNQNYADDQSEYASEGTKAHALCEFKLKQAKHASNAQGLQEPEHDAEMEECAERYVKYVWELLGDKNPARIFIEQKLDFSQWVKDGFGTADCLILDDGLITIVDFKYGKGVEVDAYQNPQMMLYALGAIQQFGVLFELDYVSMHIFQPRLGNISKYEMSRADLEKWANEVVKPIAQLAYEGKGEFKAGDHCRFCKARFDCRKRAEYNLELAKYDFTPPEKLTQDEIAFVLQRKRQLNAWAEDVEEFAKAQAINGVKFPGWKLVEGRSTRKYVDEAKIAEAVTKEGLNPYEQKLLGITAMQKLLGKNKFETLLGQYLEKPHGAPTLVPMSDKRPEWDSTQIDFKAS